MKMAFKREKGKSIATFLPPQGASATEEAVIASGVRDIGLESRIFARFVLFRFVLLCRASLSVVSLFRKK